MKRNKRIKRIAISACMLVALSSAAMFGGCTSTESTKSVVSIEKTGTSGLKDIYTITYSDGETYDFEITNGQDGDSLDAEELYEVYKTYYPDASYEDFLKAVVSVSTDENIEVSNKALCSSLKIYSQFTESYRYGMGPYQQTVKATAIYCGSAVIYLMDDDYTYIITNYHVLYDSSANTSDKLAERIICYLYGSEGAPEATSEKDSSGCTVYDYGEYAIECEYVGGSISADIAVVRAKTDEVLAINGEATAVEFADSYHVGQSAIAIGNSENEGISVTSGIVSVDNEFITYSIDGTTRSYRSMRIDTAIYGGNSGGGLFNAEGKLIGITNAGDGTDQNINYAIPLDIVKPVVENILYYKDGTVKAPELGVTIDSKNSRYVYDATKGYGTITETVVVGEVTTGSIGKALGLEEGDEIVEIVINDTSYAIERYFFVDDILYNVRSGDTLSITYKRDTSTTKSMEYTITSGDLVTVA